MKKAILSLTFFLLSQFFLPEVNGSSGCLVQVFKGNGSIYDIKTGGRITLNDKQLLNILIIAEGYTQAEHDNNKYTNDVQTWIREVELVEPLKSFKDAFIIWQYNAVSKEYIIKDDLKKSDTVLAIGVNSSGDVIDDLDETAERVWKITKKNGLIKDDYYPPGGVTGNINRNLLIVILIYDPLYGRSGFSGMARRLPNPNNKRQSLSTALAHNRPHEFLHAFARLEDEYLAVKPNTKPIPNFKSEFAPTLSNVVKDPNYTTVPWKHLLAGSAINPNVRDLVGIFGDDRNGYHSEAKCLMNGTHDNAKFYGGNGNLRVHDRLCNWCREITVFRLYERLHIFTNPAIDFETWKNEYRTNFYLKYGFTIPEIVPQVNNVGEVIQTIPSCSDVPKSE